MRKVSPKCGDCGWKDTTKYGMDKCPDCGSDYWIGIPKKEITAENETINTLRSDIYQIEEYLSYMKSFLKQKDLDKTAYYLCSVKTIITTMEENLGNYWIYGNVHGKEWDN